MLQHQPWQTNPSTGFLESFDIAVYLGGTNLLPTLAEKVATIFRVPIEHVYMIKHRVTESIEAEVRRLERETT